MLWGLLSAACFGTADFLAARSSKRLGVLYTLFSMQLVGFILLSAYLCLSGEWRDISFAGAVSASLWMFVDLIGILFLYRGLLVGKASIVAPIASSFSVVTVVLAIMFGERMTLVTFSGIILTISGVTVATITTKEPADFDAKPTQGALWAIAASLLLGIAFYGLRYPVEQVGGFVTVWIGRLQSCVLLLLLFGVLTKRKLTRPELGEWRYLIAVGALDAMAIVSYNQGLLYDKTSFVIAAASLFAVVTLGWGVLLDKERLQRHQWAGIVLTFIGILFVSIR